MQKIKLTIANRVYPLNVPIEQEEGLRLASKKIDIMIKVADENYRRCYYGTGGYRDRYSTLPD